MKFLIVAQNRTEYIQLTEIDRDVTSIEQLNGGRRKWTYVAQVQLATLFDTEFLTETARDKFCCFPWIKIRPATQTEINEYDRTISKQTRQKVIRNSRHASL